MPTLGELGWRGRYSYTSPEVVELREQLQRQAGITGIEIVDPTEPGYAQRAAEIFRRDGYVLVKSANRLFPATCKTPARPRASYDTRPHR